MHKIVVFFWGMVAIAFPEKPTVDHPATWARALFPDVEHHTPEIRIVKGEFDEKLTTAPHTPKIDEYKKPYESFDIKSCAVILHRRLTGSTTFTVDPNLPENLIDLQDAVWKGLTKKIGV